jgi:hypothetical protein
MVIKALGMDHILDSMLSRLGNLELAILVGDYAEGKDTGIIDLVLVGNINKINLIDLTEKTEKYIDRKIRNIAVSREEYEKLEAQLASQPQFILFEKRINYS